MVWVFLKDGFFDSCKVISITKEVLPKDRLGLRVQFESMSTTYQYDTEEEREQAMTKIKGTILG